MRPEQKYIMAGEHKETGKWHGLVYRNHPYPDGDERHLLLFSTDDGVDTEAEALALITKRLSDSGWDCSNPEDILPPNEGDEKDL